MKKIHISVAVALVSALLATPGFLSAGEPTSDGETVAVVAVTAAAAPATPTAVAPAPAPHCEVPCGIYADQRRFEEMLEDTETIAKAIKSVNEFHTAMANGGVEAKGINQVVRWVTTKEDHATNTQHIVSQYFLTQRIKADNENYAKQLAAAHKVMVSAMKCKQDVNPTTADDLKNSILDLYRAYEGKEPQFGAHEHNHGNAPAGENAGTQQVGSAGNLPGTQPIEAGVHTHEHATDHGHSHQHQHEPASNDAPSGR